MEAGETLRLAEKPPQPAANQAKKGNNAHAFQFNLTEGHYKLEYRACNH